MSVFAQIISFSKHHMPLHPHSLSYYSLDRLYPSLYRCIMVAPRTLPNLTMFKLGLPASVF